MIILMNSLKFLLDINTRSKLEYSDYIYSIVLREEFGIDCKKSFNQIDYLQTKLRLDKSVCL